MDNDALKGSGPSFPADLARMGGGTVGPSISGTPVLTATEDAAYTGFTVSAVGGTAPYTYSLVGTWPAGITINSSTGRSPAPRPPPAPLPAFRSRSRTTTARKPSSRPSHWSSRRRDQMTPETFAQTMQQALGDEYEGRRHSIERREPQFDVFPVPRRVDAKGNEYRVTFSVRSRHLDDFEQAQAVAYALRSQRDLSGQIHRGEAPPVWKVS